MTRLYVTMGMPGAGKTHWCTTSAATLDADLVSSDAVRTDGVDATRWFLKMREQVDHRLSAGRSAIVDACNVTTAQRRSWMTLGRAHDAHCVLVVLDTPARVALERNAQRPDGQRVPNDRMHRYAAQYASSKIVASREAWDETIVVGQGEAPPERVDLDTSRAW